MLSLDKFQSSFSEIRQKPKNFLYKKIYELQNIRKMVLGGFYSSEISQNLTDSEP